MKYLHRLLLLAAISFGIFSCQKEYSVENNTGGSNVTAQWSFKEGNIQFKGPIDTAGVDSIGNYKVFSINGHSDDKKDLINLEFFATDLKPGTYKTPYCLFAYSRNGIITYQTNQTAIDSFTIIVTKLDSTGVIGSFSGKAWDSTKTYKTIVDGKFSAVFKTNTPPASTDSGQVVLWSKAGCGGGTSTTPINVSVNGKTGQITQFGATEPTTCDPAGRYFVKLPVGTYPWTAKCGTDSISGTVTVTKGGCSKVLVDFSAAPTGDYFPIGLNYNWTYQRLGSTPNDTLFVLSTGTPKTLGGSSFNIFSNDYAGAGKDSSYYRKTPGLYYEYFLTDTSNGIASGLEHIFLKDNVTPGTSAAIWSKPFSAAITYKNQAGLPVDTVLSGTVSDTLIQKLSSYNPGAGKNYPDVLEVHSGTSVAFPAALGGNTQVSYVKQWLARGVGLIKYYEWDLTDQGPVDYTYYLLRYKAN
jgi:hypothetical protein